jgi:UDP-N-acetyl-D-mannosaminuronic acid dehydrogenase
VNILNPGSGVGGHCIAIDPWFLIASVPDQSKFIHEARLTNDHKPFWVIEKTEEIIQKFIETNKRRPIVACMGLAFKPDIDDLRESPSLIISERLKQKNIDLLVAEPNISRHKTFELTDPQLAVDQADIILFLVAHREFRELIIPEGKIIVDICGVKQKNI